MFDWLSLNGIVKGAIVEFSEAPIASIPFKPINWNSEEEVRLHNSITKEVGKYIKDDSEDRIVNINKYFKQLFHE